MTLYCIRPIGISTSPVHIEAEGLEEAAERAARFAGVIVVKTNACKDSNGVSYLECLFGNGQPVHVFESKHLSPLWMKGE